MVRPSRTITLSTTASATYIAAKLVGALHLIRAVDQTWSAALAPSLCELERLAQRSLDGDRTFVVGCRSEGDPIVLACRPSGHQVGEPAFVWSRSALLSALSERSSVTDLVIARAPGARLEVSIARSTTRVGSLSRQQT